MRLFRYLISAALLALLFSSCGLKKPLRLPDEARPVPNHSEP